MRNNLLLLFLLEQVSFDGFKRFLSQNMYEGVAMWKCFVNVNVGITSYGIIVVYVLKEMFQVKKRID